MYDYSSDPWFSIPNPLLEIEDFNSELDKHYGCIFHLADKHDLPFNRVFKKHLSNFVFHLCSYLRNNGHVIDEELKDALFKFIKFYATPEGELLSERLILAWIGQNLPSPGIHVKKNEYGNVLFRLGGFRTYSPKTPVNFGKLICQLIDDSEGK